MDTVVVTTRKMRSKETKTQGFPFRIKHSLEKGMFGAQPVWLGQTRVNVPDHSRTLVDIPDDASLGGGIRQVADVIDTYFGEEQRDDELLSTYVGRAGNCVVGYILEALEVHAPALLQACESGVHSGVSRLDPSLPNEDPVAWRRNLRVNGRVQSEKALTSALCLPRSLQAAPKAAKVDNV